MSRKFDDFLNEQLNDAEIRSEYEVLQTEHALIQAMIDTGQESGITQGDISKLERGNVNPSIRTLQRLAKGMGKVLKIEFIPEKV